MEDLIDKTSGSILQEDLLLFISLLNVIDKQGEIWS